MTTITYTIGNKKGTISWAAAEQFNELENTIFSLAEMEATQIEKRANLSTTAKILLSAVAGAIIQHLIDQGYATNLIFSQGSFVVDGLQLSMQNLNYTPFLDSFFEQIHLIGLDVTGLPLDHSAYQASTKEEYEQLLPTFSQLGELVSEEIIGERRVAVVHLDQPLAYKEYSISALELIEPKAGQQCESGFQHAEFVVNQPFEKYIELYPSINWDTSSMYRDEFAHLKLNFDNGLTLKFLQKPIIELFAEKKQQK
jgi:predicted metalloenzyme YecM